MNFNEIMKNIITDVKVKLTEEFDRNFERKAFFDKPWKNARGNNARGSLMMRSGKLRRSMRSSQSKTGITWSSALPYASLHNQGGEVIVTEKMKRFFWAMFIKADGGTTFKRDKDKNVVMRDTARNRRLSSEAQMWKAMALQKVGTKMKIEQRQFIGDHPKVKTMIQDIINENMQNLNLTQRP